MGLDKDDIKQLIAILQKGLTDDTNSGDDIVETQPKTKIKRTKSKNSGKSTKEKRDNLFERMSEFGMHKEDVEIDRKLAKHPRTHRSRNFTPVTVKCRVCGRDESVNPVLVESKERYKCNRCSRAPG
jgi:lysyl-tRNA synthetase class I